MFDKLKKAKAFWDKHGSKIQSALIHGKNVVEKGKEFLASEDGQKALNFAKEKLRRQNGDEIHSNEDEKKDSKDDESNDDLNDKKVGEDIVDVQAEPIIEKDESQDTFFEDKRDELVDAAKRGLMNLNNPEEVLNALCKLQSVANETIKYTEEQETKRVEINAKKEVAIEKIKTIERCIKDYLDKTFDERRSIFAKEFECVDAALKTGNLELLSVSLSSINSLAAQSPFKALADVAAVQKNLLDTNTEWDI